MFHNGKQMQFFCLIKQPHNRNIMVLCSAYWYWEIHLKYILNRFFTKSMCLFSTLVKNISISHENIDIIANGTDCLLWKAGSGD